METSFCGLFSRVVSFLSNIEGISVVYLDTLSRIVRVP